MVGKRPRNAHTRRGFLKETVEECDEPGRMCREGKQEDERVGKRNRKVGEEEKGGGG